MIRILLLGEFTEIVVGNRAGNEYHYDRLVSDTGIDGNEVEHAGRNRCGNLTDKIPRELNRIRSVPFCYLKPRFQTDVTGYFPQTSHPVTVGYDGK